MENESVAKELNVESEDNRRRAPAMPDDEFYPLLYDYMDEFIGTGIAYINGREEVEGESGEIFSPYPLFSGDAEWMVEWATEDAAFAVHEIAEGKTVMAWNVDGTAVLYDPSVEYNAAIRGLERGFHLGRRFEQWLRE